MVYVNKDSPCISDSVRQTQAEAGEAKEYLRPVPLFGGGRGGEEVCVFNCMSVIVLG